MLESQQMPGRNVDGRPSLLWALPEDARHLLQRHHWPSAARMGSGAQNPGACAGDELCPQTCSWVPKLQAPYLHDGDESGVWPFMSFLSPKHSSDSVQHLVRGRAPSLPLFAPSSPPAAMRTLSWPANLAFLCQIPVPPADLCVGPGWCQSHGRPDHIILVVFGAGPRNGTWTNGGCGKREPWASAATARVRGPQVVG